MKTPSFAQTAAIAALPTLVGCSAAMDLGRGLTKGPTQEAFYSGNADVGIPVATSEDSPRSGMTIIDYTGFTGIEITNVLGFYEDVTACTLEAAALPEGTLIQLKSIIENDTHNPQFIAFFPTEDEHVLVDYNEALDCSTENNPISAIHVLPPPEEERHVMERIFVNIDSKKGQEILEPVADTMVYYTTSDGEIGSLF